MKGRIVLATLSGTGGAKKRSTHKIMNNVFFVHGVTQSESQHAFLSYVAVAAIMGTPQSYSCNGTSVALAAAGLLVDLRVQRLLSMPAVAFFSAFTFFRGGLARLQVAPGRVRLRAFRFLYQCLFVKEYIVTLTNHTSRICELAGMVRGFADGREYEKAHCALDDIEAKVHSVRRHIDNLQWFTHKVPRPKGD